MKNIYHYKPAISGEDIEKCDCIPGILAASIKARSRWDTNKDSFFNRFKTREGYTTGRWEDFLLNDGVKTMWQLDATGESIIGKKRKFGDVG